jgi:hypothetical protein
MGANITDPKEKLAVGLMADAWERVANAREAALERGVELVPGNSFLAPSRRRLEWDRASPRQSRWPV